MCSCALRRFQCSKGIYHVHSLLLHCLSTLPHLLQPLSFLVSSPILNFKMTSLIAICRLSLVISSTLLFFLASADAAPRKLKPCLFFKYRTVYNPQTRLYDRLPPYDSAIDESFFTINAGQTSHDAYVGHARNGMDTFIMDLDKNRQVHLKSIVPGRDYIRAFYIRSSNGPGVFAYLRDNDECKGPLPPPQDQQSSQAVFGGDVTNVVINTLKIRPHGPKPHP